MSDMEILQSLEHPLPTLSVDVDRIEAASGSSFSRLITIKNRGGGVLEGEVFTNSMFAGASPSSFSENQAVVELQADLSGLSLGETLETFVYIVSNGGEKEIPVSLRHEESLMAPGGVKIASLEDFSAYAEKSWSQAAALMRKPELRVFLGKIKPDLRRLYDVFIQDADAGRSLESFLRAAAGKAPPRLEIPQRRFTAHVKPFERGPVEGLAPVKIEGWGRLDDDITVDASAKWLSAPASVTEALRGASSGFVPFAVDPLKLPGKRAVASISIGGAGLVWIEAVRLPMFKARASKETYAPGQTGHIIIDNYSGAEFLAEVAPDESFLRFDARRYAVKEKAEIPFAVRLTAMQSLAVRRRLEIPASVTVRAMARGEAAVAKISLSVGGWQ
jgi:hypothetical protein